MKIEITESEIISKFLGMQYEHGADGADNKIDCFQLAVQIYKLMGYDIWCPAEYPTSDKWSQSLFYMHYYKQWQRVEKPVIYDIVLFNRWDVVGASHAGVVFKHNKFIHCCKVGVVINDLDIPKVKPLIEGYYHLTRRSI